MIAHISGRLVNKTPESIIVDVGGVGYEIIIPLSTYYKLPDLQEKVSIMVYTHHREDAIRLYGFLTVSEREIFQLLIGVSGVGPKQARNILSGIEAEELADALSSGDLGRLMRIPGVGGKTAERLALELREKVRINRALEERAGDDEREGIFRDLLSALVNLGYKSKQAEAALRDIRKNSDGETDFEALFKRALKILAR